jgi:hypothetical protein
METPHNRGSVHQHQAFIEPDEYTYRDDLIRVIRQTLKITGCDNPIECHFCDPASLGRKPDQSTCIQHEIHSPTIFIL